ncbi:uncharacterized protein LOC127859340 isoform X3 [Dreissena polymorpha]|uniref:Uncharacterized protein n=1 Tax=Dreissena polymorpha TaxID=45954 RepID=A0A9D3YQU2_DREPO|nr:uncharacterized protein LOC127859340 isoform X3 [Dreissena polymorpha]KAH3703209.1 hypothetical protein DPMN_078240 [Dreissena polymorpha]
MGFSDSSLFLKIAFILLIAAFIIQVLALAIPYWFSLDAGNYETYGSLFRICSESPGYKLCVNVENATSWWEATQAFEVIGILLIIAALILTIVVVFVKSDMKILKLVAWILSFCACGFIIVGIIIYGAKSYLVFAEYSGAFALAIIAGIIMAVAGILGLMDWMNKGK